MKKLILQIIKFCAVGGICFVIDYLLLVLLTELLKLNVITSSAISFTFSTVINYILNALFVFKTGNKKNKSKEFIAFLLISLLGLGINQAVMVLFVNKLNVYYTVSKIISAVIVTAYNYVAKKYIFEKLKSEETNG